MTYLFDPDDDYETAVAKGWTYEVQYTLGVAHDESVQRQVRGQAEARSVEEEVHVQEGPQGRPQLGLGTEGVLMDNDPVQFAEALANLHKDESYVLVKPDYYMQLLEYEAKFERLSAFLVDHPWPEVRDAWEEWVEVENLREER